MCKKQSIVYREFETCTKLWCQHANLFSNKILTSLHKQWHPAVIQQFQCYGDVPVGIQAIEGYKHGFVRQEEMCYLCYMKHDAPSGQTDAQLTPSTRYCIHTAAFESRSKVNYALAVIALFWVKYSFDEHRHPFGRNLTWPSQLICLEIIITLIFSIFISIYASFSHFISRKIIIMIFFFPVALQPYRALADRAAAAGQRS